jgi:hypothetical protein
MLVLDSSVAAVLIYKYKDRSTDVLLIQIHHSVALPSLTVTGTHFTVSSTVQSVC